MLCNFCQYSSGYDAFCAGETPPVFDPACAGGALMDLGVYNVSYIVGLFGEPNQVHYTANVERGIDTSGILLLEYPDFICQCTGAKDCAAPGSVQLIGDAGRILINGKVAKASQAVNAGDIIEVTFGNRPIKVRVLSDVEPRTKAVAREMCEVIAE